MINNLLGLMKAPAITLHSRREDPVGRVCSVRAGLGMLGHRRPPSLIHKVTARSPQLAHITGTVVRSTVGEKRNCRCSCSKVPGSTTDQLYFARTGHSTWSEGHTRPNWQAACHLQMRRGQHPRACHGPT